MLLQLSVANSMRWPFCKLIAIAYCLLPASLTPELAIINSNKKSMESMLLVSRRGGFARPVRIETFEPYPCSQYAKAIGQNIFKQAKGISIEDSSNIVFGQIPR